jgi:hypothetical protein
MSHDPLVKLEPFAVRPKEGARLAGVGLTKFYEELNRGVYQTFTDGFLRFVVTQSIFDHQKRLAKEQQGTPAAMPSKRKGGPGRRRKTQT